MSAQGLHAHLPKISRSTPRLYLVLGRGTPRAAEIKNNKAQFPVARYQKVHAPGKPELAANHTARHAAVVELLDIEIFSRFDGLAGQILYGVIDLLWCTALQNIPAICQFVLIPVHSNAAARLSTSGAALSDNPCPDSARIGTKPYRPTCRPC